MFYQLTIFGLVFCVNSAEIQKFSSKNTQMLR